MPTTSPTRVDDDLFASAKITGEVMHRSASQQICHWARIGRELEAAASVSQRAVAEVLAGARSYDGLSAEEQAIVRAEWAQRMAQRRHELDLAAEFAMAGRPYVEMDAEGKVVRRVPGADPGPTT